MLKDSGMPRNHNGMPHNLNGMPRNRSGTQQLTMDNGMREKTGIDGMYQK